MAENTIEERLADLVRDQFERGKTYEEARGAAKAANDEDGSGLTAEQVAKIAFEAWGECVERKHGQKLKIVDDLDLENEDAPREWPENPPWRKARASNPSERKPELICGVLRRGHVMGLAAKGKIGKTYLIILLAVCVAYGLKWLLFECKPGRVLIVNPEVDEDSFDNRIHEICKRLDLDPKEADEKIDVWTTRADPETNMTSIAETMEHYVERGHYSLIVIDSVSVFVEGNENEAGAVRKVTTLAGSIGEKAFAGVVIVLHYGKGNQGERDAGDRARGSSVWLDGPDATLTLTEVYPPSGEVSDYLPDGQEAYLVEAAGMREFKKFEPFTVVHDHPLVRPDEDGTCAEWGFSKGNGSEGGRARKAVEDANRERDFANHQNRLVAEFMQREDAGRGITCKEAAELLGIGTKDPSRTLNKMFTEYGEPFDYEEGDFSTKAYRTDLLVMRKRPSSRPTKDDPGKPSQAYYVYPRFKTGQMELDLDD